MKLGLVQQANSSDRAANIEKLKQNIRACALQGAELVVLQELHLQRASERWQRNWGSYWYFLCLRNELPVCIIIRLSLLRKTALLPENIVKCIFRMIRPIMRSSILLPVISDLSRSRLLLVNWVYWFVGISGIPKQPA